MIVVVDIETTGLDPSTNLILEVGIVVLRDNNVFTSKSMVCGLPYKPPMDEVVKEMHSKSGLLEEVLSSKTPYYDVQNELIYWLKAQEATGQPMCGSSVHFDRSFLRYWMPELESLFHYRNIDVSTIKNLAERWNPEVFEKRPEGRKLHRAIPDCQDTIEELLYYRDNFLKLGD